jgi:hypothetical protein
MDNGQPMRRFSRSSPETSSASTAQPLTQYKMQAAFDGTARALRAEDKGGRKSCSVYTVKI